MALHTLDDLKQRQSLPLDIKVRMTEQRIREWVNEFGIGGVYVSFSGGKDSTVLLHIARRLYPDIPAVFVDTGLEYPEIRNFVKTFDNVEWLKPEMNFKQVIEKYGYPFISKEVSECVQGARKYLHSLIADGTIITDRQTDRQTDRRHKYSYQYDKLFGVGRYAKKENGKPRGRCKREATNNVGSVATENSQDGDYP